MTPENIVAWSAAVQAFAAVATLLVTLFLVTITRSYVKLTRGILDETSKARLAAEQSASAAQSSASAAFQSIHLMREQIEEAAGLGKLIVQSTIDSAVKAITYWMEHDLANWVVVRSLAPTQDLFPTKATSALDHAARINPEGSALLSSAFDDLKTCCAEIEHLRNVATIQGAWPGEIQGAHKTKQLLSTTFDKFTKAKALFL